MPKALAAPAGQALEKILAYLDAKGATPRAAGAGAMTRAIQSAFSGILVGLASLQPFSRAARV